MNDYLMLMKRSMNQTYLRYIISVARMKTTRGSRNGLLILLALFLAFLPTWAYSQEVVKEYVVSGCVKVEASDSVVSKASIQVRNQSRKVISTIVSDNGGKFSVKVPAGEYSLFILHNGFYPNAVKVKVTDSDQTVGNVALRPVKSDGNKDAKNQGERPRIIIGGGGGSSVSAKPKTEGKHRVNGRILEAGRKRSSPLSLCKIYVTGENGEKVARTLTLDDGIFNFEVSDGRYKALIENTGHRSKVLSVEVNGKDVSLGDIYLEIGEEIASAGIESESLINRKGTRIVYDVSKDPDRSKINMTEMISRIPELRMASSNGKLQFENQSISEILIDNSESGLINVNRQYPMEFIKADHMKQVEVVLPGDIEYNNDRPMLLISLAKALPYGFASNLEMRSTTKNSHSPSADVVINTPLIGIGLGYDYSYDSAPTLTNESVREMTDSSSHTRKIASSQSSHNKSNTHNIRSNLFRTFANEKIKFNASLNASYSDATSFSESRIHTFFTDGTSNESVTSVSGSSKSPFRLNGSMRLTGYFGAPTGLRGKGKNQWRVEYAYKDSRNQRENDYTSYIQESFYGLKEHRAIASVNLRNIVTSPISLSSMIKGGYYGRHYDSRNSTPSQTDGLDYHQQVCFADIFVLGDALNKKIGYMLSLGNEYLKNSGEFLNASTSSPLDYSSYKFNPTASMNWRFKRGSLGLSYVRSVRRPNINQLNPYEDRSNPYYIRTGNPDLKGEKTDMCSVNFMMMPNIKWIQSLSASISYSNANDLISRIVTSSGDGVATSTYQNVGSSESAGLSFMATLVPLKKVSVSLIASYRKTTSVLPSGQKNTFDTPSASVSVNWHPAWVDVSGSISVRPSINSIQTAKTILEPSGDISISRYFKRPHLGCSVNATDIFHRGGRMESEIRNTNFTQRNFYERLGRTFSFRVYWRFGKFRQTETVDVKAYDM